MVRKTKASTSDQSAAELSDVSTPLFSRVAEILESARAHVVWQVNSQMVLAYWLIGREIVQAV
ncbi:hypothetical protein [Nitrosomonas sp.]|uniref:hypothetical protein n=1 Tax=Nitrosomonas sp. TaxID=42353 RepID=UPI0026390D53|nr:hypothetical protein [Nitrosomonas sp.]